MADKIYTTPLLQKLGIQQSGVNLVVSAPDSFIEKLEGDDIQSLKLQAESLDFI